MFRRIIATLFMMALVVIPVNADDSNAKPHAAAEKPVLFINTNIFPFGLVATNETYREFANIAREMGFVADHGWLTELDKEFLDSIDVLVLSIPALTLLDEDKENLRAFIKGGGGVWILGYSSFFVPDLSNLDSFIRDYGITFAAVTFGPTNGTVTPGSILSGPEIVSIIRSPFIRVGLTVDTSKAATQAVLDNGQILVAISTSKFLGRGKLVVHGDASMLAKEFGISEIDLKDNRNFARNILSYFLGKSDLKVILAKMKKKFAVAGKLTTAVTRIKNIGTSDSDQVKVQFILSDGENGTPKPADDLAVLKTIKLKSLEPGKSIKISQKVKIPGWVTPGVYYIVTVVDPDGESNDADPDNNRKVGKKFTVM